MPERPRGEFDTKEQLKQLIGGEPSIIYLMSGGVAPGRTVDYKSTSMLDPDNADGTRFGYLGGALRVHAVAYLHEHFPDAQIVTSSTVNGVSHAAVQERELRTLWAARNIPVPEQIIREEGSNSAQTELAEAIRLVLGNNWTGNILLVTNEYHTARVGTMLDGHLPNLRAQAGDHSFGETWNEFQTRTDVSLRIQAAEPILEVVNPRWRRMLGNVFEREPWRTTMENRQAAEARGIQAIVSGSYNPANARRS